MSEKNRNFNEGSPQLVISRDNFETKEQYDNTVKLVISIGLERNYKFTCSYTDQKFVLSYSEDYDTDNAEL